MHDTVCTNIATDSYTENASIARVGIPQTDDEIYLFKLILPHHQDAV